MAGYTEIRLFRGYIGFKVVDITSILENEMETGIMWWFTGIRVPP